MRAEVTIYDDQDEKVFVMAVPALHESKEVRCDHPWVGGVYLIHGFRFQPFAELAPPSLDMQEPRL